jgi:signal transduction histidine kinase/3-oxoacyl-(acyl-carrier-protein) synthase
MNEQLQQMQEILQKSLIKIKKLELELAQAKENTTAPNEAIAIIGTGVRLAGNITSTKKLWDLLEARRSVVSKIPKDRFDVDEIYSPDSSVPGKTVSKFGTFLSNDVRAFDADFFGISPREAKSVDPLQRMILEVVYEALENAGISSDSLKGSNTGVYIALGNSDYIQARFRSGNLDSVDVYDTTGIPFGTACGRVSYLYDWKGTSFALDAACASSLLAVHLANEDLNKKIIDTAIVASANLLLTPEPFVGLSKLGSLSSGDACKAFANDADGYVRGEGCGVVVLKRLSDAENDNDNVAVIIKGSAVKHNGRSNGFTAPNPEIQIETIQEALKKTNLSVNDIDYVEAHGIGNRFTDALEIQAIHEGYKDRRKPIYVGSVKANVGHLEAGTGMPMLFKVIETSPTTLLVSSESGLFVFQKKRRSYHRIPYFGLNRGRFPFMDATGRLYISNDNLHVGRLRDTAWIPEKTLPVTHRFRNGFEDTLHHVIWGSTTNGAKMINPRDWSVRLWNKKDGLNDAYIYDVLVDKQGKVWFSTNRGISRLDLKTKKIDNFKLSDGLQSNEFNSNTAHIAPDGEFFFGGVRGFNHFYPEEVQINTQLATPILTDFKVKEKPFKLPVVIGETSQIQLSADNNTFSIEYSAIDYLSNGQNTYQYRLIGLDSTWIQANRQTNPLFIQVPAGKYIFEVKAANSDGIWNAEPTRLFIEIAPQLWETIWFRAAMLVLLLAGLYGFYRYRLYVIKQQQRKEMAVMVETQEAERMRFAQDLHDGLGANLSAMKMVLGLLNDPASLPIKAKTEYLLKESIDDLRQLIHAMSPRSLARLGLVKAVQELSILINQSSKVEVQVLSEDFPENLPDEMQLNLYRMVQELFQNALKHAHATHITLKLEQNSGSLMLYYTDNGCGFDIVAHTSGNGLSNLHTRSQLLNGTLDIKSVVGEGTMVRVEVPF